MLTKSEERAVETALTRAARAYEGFLPKAEAGEKFEDRCVKLPDASAVNAAAV
jgi:hypothetical protein